MRSHRGKRLMSFEDALEMAKKACVLSEKCPFDIRMMLIRKGYPNSDIEEINRVLIEEGFINVERFTNAFVRGKFNQLRWGKRKIAIELKEKRIENSIAEEALESINKEQYTDSIRNLANSKLSTLVGKSHNDKKSKTINFLVSKGYELDLVIPIIESLLLIK
jgi:regulatory protein